MGEERAIKGVGLVGHGEGKEKNQSTKGGTIGDKRTSKTGQNAM